MRKQEYEPYFMCMVLVSVVILAVNIYSYEYPLFMSLGLRSDISDRVMLSFRSHGFFSSYLKTKLLSLALIVMSNIVRSGKGKPAKLYQLIGIDDGAQDAEEEEAFGFRPCGYGVQNFPEILEACKKDHNAVLRG